MWESISIFVLRYRLFFLLGLLGFTGFMGWKATDIKFTYDFARIVPDDDPMYLDYLDFQKRFGEDGNIMVIGMQNHSLFDLSLFNDWYKLGQEIKSIDGIENIISVPHAQVLIRDPDTRKLKLRPLVSEMPHTQSEVDSIRQQFLDLPFYQGLIYNPKTHATIMGLTFDPQKLDSKARLGMVDTILTYCDAFQAQHTNTDLHYSGLPYLRTYNMITIRKELTRFLILAMVILAAILFVLFRNIYAVIFPLIVVVFGAIWSVGTLALLGYKITILTGLLPTLIVVIGIPNCVYMLNMYHGEFKKHGNKQKALARTIAKIGRVTFFTNLTTAIGFGVFFLANTELLDEFGLVAFLNILATFLISVIAIPVMFSYLPEPKSKHTMHLDAKVLNFILDRFEVWAKRHRRKVYAIFGSILAVALVGVIQLKSEGYILDDVSKKSTVYRDLKFFERNFDGIMPFEISIDSKRERGATNLNFVRKVAQLSDSLQSMPVFSKPLSVADGFKFLMQAYYNGNPNGYRLPTNFEMSQNASLRSFLKNADLDGGGIGLASSFIDSSGQVARLSVQMADIGSDSLPKLLTHVRPVVDSIFPPDKYDVNITGTSIIAIEGFNFLIDGLILSVGLAFILISLIMAYLFRSVKMLILALIPNIIPLIVTAGIMGWLHISLKPSTVLIFSVAFGISVDYTIHFLAKYRQELYRHNWDITRTVATSLRETGVSMIYTSLILFCGFIVFTGSEFQGTANLGRLTSITLIVAMLSNLVFLPSLLISFERFEDRKAIRKEPLIDVYNEEEDIEMDKLDFKHEESDAL